MLGMEGCKSVVTWVPYDRACKNQKVCQRLLQRKTLFLAAWETLDNDFLLALDSRLLTQVTP